MTGAFAAARLAAAFAAQPSSEYHRTEVPFEAGRVITRPSASIRHALLAAAPTIPADGIGFNARCMIARTDGHAFNCTAPDVPEAWRAAAVGLAAQYRLDLTGVQFGKDRWGEEERSGMVTIADRIVPADVRPPARLFRYSAAGPGDVVIETGFGLAVMSYYPVAALRANEEVQMQVDCEVQPDLGLFCLNASLAPGSPPTNYLGAFQLATYQIMGNARVAAALDNGTLAVGRIFRRTIHFRIPQE